MGCSEVGWFSRLMVVLIICIRCEFCLVRLLWNSVCSFGLWVKSWV